MNEDDLLPYTGSFILVAQHKSAMLGGLRGAIGVGTPSGILTDLVVGDLGDRRVGTLITLAETRLGKLGVRTINGVVKDGQGLVRYFYQQGYQPVRRTVRLVWDLENLPKLETNPTLRVQSLKRPNIRRLAFFVANSYQPYWTFWKDAKNPEKEIAARLTSALKNTYMIWTASWRGERCGICDAKIPKSVNADTFELGIILSKHHPGKKIGSTLLAKPLMWLKEQGVKRAQAAVTSGLDDYDPVVYLATLSTGAIIDSEYIVLQKNMIQ